MTTESSAASSAAVPAAAPALDLLQGTLDVLILRTLAVQPTHGYGVSRWIRERTGGVLQVQDAALYKALRRLERRGHVAAEWGVTEQNRRARYYALTEAGRKALTREAAAWRSYAAAVFTVLDPTPGEA
jgi:PadR family transcriptional regulator, regulatory protein PadR